MLPELLTDTYRPFSLRDIDIYQHDSFLASSEPIIVLPLHQSSESPMSRANRESMPTKQKDCNKVSKNLFGVSANAKPRGTRKISAETHSKETRRLKRRICDDDQVKTKLRGQIKTLKEELEQEQEKNIIAHEVCYVSRHIEINLCLYHSLSFFALRMLKIPSLWCLQLLVSR